MNLKEIKELIDLLTEKGISEFEWERSGVRLRISRNPANRVVEVMTASVNPAMPVAAPQQSGAERSSPARESEKPSPAEDDLYIVRSPMVGTFYAAPTQGAEPFVQVGDRVQPGQVLCIIEAMKLMNELEAEIAGELLRCYVENGQPVEYGEPLFEVRPSPGYKKRS